MKDDNDDAKLKIIRLALSVPAEELILLIEKWENELARYPSKSK